MGVKEKKAKYKEEFRREVINSARDLFVKDGYEKFTMRSLAQKIDFSPATIYQYFKNKDELLSAICEGDVKELLTNMRNIREHQDNPLEVLRQVMLYFIEFAFDHPDHYKIFHTLKPDIYGTPTDYMDKKSFARDAHLEFREILKACVKAGKLRRKDIDVVAQVLECAGHSLLLTIIPDTSYPWADRKVLTQTLVDILLNGVKK